MRKVQGYSIENDPIGKGQFGKVFRCFHKSKPQKKFAVKVIHKPQLTPRLFHNLKNEINILTKIQSPYVIQLYDLQRTENNYYLIMQLCNGGDLDNLKNLRGRFKEQEARIILQQIVMGFKEIYKKEVMHRDLKLANILVHFKDPQVQAAEQISNLQERKEQVELILRDIDLINTNFQIKIADLGFARELSHEDVTQTTCGTPIVMAPEVLNGRKYNHKADVWSLGIIFFEMITGFMPFTGQNKEELKKNLEKGTYKFPKKLRMSIQGLDFLNCCLQFDSSKRMSWSQLIDHPYIKFQHNSQDNDELIHLSYCEYQGQYIKKEILKQQNKQNVIDSTQLMMNNPYTYLNEKNAILLNVKDPSKFKQIYEDTLKKHLRKKNYDNITSDQPIMKINKKNTDLLSQTEVAKQLNGMNKNMPDPVFNQGDDSDDDDSEDYDSEEEQKEHHSNEDNPEDEHSQGYQFNANSSQMDFFDIEAIKRKAQQIEEQKQQEKLAFEASKQYILDERIDPRFIPFNTQASQNDQPRQKPQVQSKQQKRQSDQDFEIVDSRRIQENEANNNQNFENIRINQQNQNNTGKTYFQQPFF
ncbi:protein kinase domain containing protein [Stylonychia lemnae]|uniref:Protein kinase domain containing protein n=1 Tax=Stylonychia lemnae TaxID=5949 RepID=A0A078A121_STYLE|nr:protein kinase domain containing protein [Stylonychia lemnae]|eukprot:CDW75810.1 protein kinase domain containing protein [Stylonychia lemnae]